MLKLMGRVRVSRGLEGEEKRLPDAQAPSRILRNSSHVCRGCKPSDGQMKLAVGSTDDPAEHEADAVADLVVGRIRRGAIEHDGPAEEDIRRSPAERIRRRAGGGDAGRRRRDTEQRIKVGGEVAIRSDDVASDMSAGFGTDLSHVRLHTGPEAAELNNRLQAKAFTVGSDVFRGIQQIFERGQAKNFWHTSSRTLSSNQAAPRLLRYVEALSVHEIELCGSSTPLAME